MKTGPGLAQLHLQSHLGLATRYSLRHLLAMADLRDALARCDWHDAAFFGSASMGAGHASYQRLVTEMDISPVQLRYQILTDAIRASVDKLGRPSERLVAFQLIMDEVRSQSQDIQNQWLGPLAALSSGDMAPLIETFTIPSADSDTGLAHAIAGTIALLTYGLHGTIQAEFNLVYDRQSIEKAAVVGWDFSEAFATLIDRFEETLLTCQKRLFTILKSSSGSVGRAYEIRLVIDTLTATIERELPPFVRIQGVASAAMLVLRQEQHHSLLAHLGESMCRAATLTRQALATFSTAHDIGISLAQPRLPERLQCVIHIPARLPFDAPSGTPIQVPLTDLMNVDDGDRIQMSGMITHVEMKRVGSEFKRRSIIAMTAPETGATANAVAMLIDAPHRGVAEGGWVRLNGRYWSSSALLNGEPALEVDRLPLSSHDPSTWREAFMLAARDWIEVWPYGLDMAWSLSPHRPCDSADMQHLGAGEVIFRSPLPSNPEL